MSLVPKTIPGPKGQTSGIVRSSAPDNSPLLKLLKDNLRKETNDEDNLLQFYVDSAVNLIERQVSISLFNQEWELSIDAGVPALPIYLPRGPVVSVTAFNYYASDDSELAFTGFTLDVNADRLLLKDGYTWPYDTREWSAHKITYATGHGTKIAQLPPTLVQGVLLLASTWNADRDMSCQLSTSMMAMVNNLKAVHRKRRPV